MAYAKALSIRRADGQVKQCEVKCKEFLDGQQHGRSYAKKSSRDVYRPQKVIRDYVDRSQILVVCEKETISLGEPFTRRLPSCFAHELFFGDLIICYHDDRGVQRDLFVDDFAQITSGTHPLWCLINASSDVGEKQDEHDDDDGESDELEDESSEGENEDDDEDDDDDATNEDDEEEEVMSD